MDVRELVTSHYGAGNLGERILHALAEHGVDTDRLGPADLFAVDQLHFGGAPAVQHLLDRMDVGPGSRLIDVGCGIGGASRMAAMAGAAVTGVDLTPEFVDTATRLTAQVGLSDRATFVTTPGDSLPAEDDSFDAAVLVHVGMNIPDKGAVFQEIHRVLAPGGVFGLYEQVRTGDGELPYPLPWAQDQRSSFVETVEDYRAQLEAAGFTVENVEDQTQRATTPPPQGPVTNAVIFGPAFVERIGNDIAATKAGLLATVMILARA